MATEKLTTRLKNKTGTNPQIKNHKKSHERRLIRPQTPHIRPQTPHTNSEHMYLNS